MADTSAAYRRIAEWHIPNRVIYAKDNRIPPAQLWTFLPTRCHHCKRERKITDLEINIAMHLRCADRRGCEKFVTGKEPPEPPPTPAPAPSSGAKKIIRKRK